MTKYSKRTTCVLNFLACFIAMIAFIGAAKINVDYLEKIPHVQDSVNYWFQAQLFGSGRIWIEAPENVKYFSSELIVVMNNRWYSHYPFLLPFLFMIAMKFGLIWLLNPLIAAASVWLIFRIGALVYSPFTGLWAAIFLVSSPFFMVMSASFMSHPLGLFLTSLVLWFFVRQLRNPSEKNAIGIGSSLALLLNTRPLTALALSLPVISFHFRNRVLFKGLFKRSFITMLAFYVLGIGMFFAYSSHLSGKTLQFATNTTVSDTKGPSTIPLINRFTNSFAAAGVAKGGHTPEHALGTTKALLELLHTYTLNWPAWFNFSFFLIPLIPTNRKEEDSFFYWTFASIPLWYSLYFRSAIMYGPRYIYEVLPMVVLLSARGMDVCVEAIEWLHHNSPMRTWKTLTAARGSAMVFLWLFAGWLVYTNVDQFYITDKYDLRSHPAVSLVPMKISSMKNFNGVRRSIQDEIEKWSITNAVVFVESGRWQGFGSVASFNHPLLNTDIIYAKDLGPGSFETVLNMFPGKAGYWTTYPRVQIHRLVYDEESDSYIKELLKK